MVPVVEVGVVEVEVLFVVDVGVGVVDVDVDEVVFDVLFDGVDVELVLVDPVGEVVPEVELEVLALEVFVVEVGLVVAPLVELASVLLVVVLVLVEVFLGVGLGRVLALPAPALNEEPEDFDPFVVEALALKVDSLGLWIGPPLPGLITVKKTIKKIIAEISKIIPTKAAINSGLLVSQRCDNFPEKPGWET